MSRYFINAGSAIEELVVGEKLGGGAVANVFSVRAPVRLTDSAAKIYLDPGAVDAERLGALVERVPTQLWTGQAASTDYPQYAWPQQVVYTKSAFGKGMHPAGLLMPKVDLFQTVPLDALFDPATGSAQGLDAHRLALPRKVAIGINLCKLLGAMHSRQVYCVDPVPKDILVHRNSGIVTLLGCDGYSVVSGNGNYYPAKPPAMGHVAPEVLKNKGVNAELAETQACFALAIVLFQLFDYGTYPFSGAVKKGWQELANDDERVAAGYYPYGLHPSPAISPLPSSVHDCLPGALREMFERAFRGGKGRPSAGEWEAFLQGLREKAKYVACSEHPDDPEHIHFAGMPCCRCARDKRTASPDGGETSDRLPEAGADKQPGEPPVAVPAAMPKAAATVSGVAKSRRGVVGIVWIAAVALAVALFAFLGSPDGDGRPMRMHRSPLPASQEAGVAKETGTGASISPAMPFAGGAERKPFTPEEIYYCLAKEVWKDAVSEILSRNGMPAPASFVVEIADYNARCRNYAYSEADLATARRSLERNRSAILDDAAAVVESFGKLAPATATARTDEVRDGAMSAAAQRAETGLRPQPESPRMQGAPAVAGQRERAPAARVMSAPQAAEKDGVRNVPDGGKAVVGQPDPAVADGMPAVAPRQERPLAYSLLGAIQRGDRAMVNEYLNRGANPNEPLSNGASPLKSAVVSSSTQVAELLVNRGADINATDGAGRTALFWARRMNDPTMVQMLRGHGAQD